MFELPFDGKIQKPRCHALVLYITVANWCDMDNGLQVVRYGCGHQYLTDLDSWVKRNEWYRLAEPLACSECCKISAVELGINTQVYVNMQRLSEKMSALVLEVTEVCPLLEALLIASGYSRCGRSLDELSPGGAAECGPYAVWRKEFWFAVDTDPLHVIALIDLVKEEARWLADYLPNPYPVRYFEFPPSE